MNFGAFGSTNGDEERNDWSRLSLTLTSNVHKITQNVNKIQRLIDDLETNEKSEDLRTQLNEIQEKTSQLTRETKLYLQELSRLPLLVQSSFASVDQNRRNPLMNDLNTNIRKTFSFNNNSKQFSVEKFMSPSSLLSKKSNFYEGKTVFGGANTSRAARLAGTTPYNLLHRPHLAPVLRVNIETSKRLVESNEPLSTSSQRILEKLEKAATPLQDARRIPSSSQLKSYFQTSNLMHTSSKRPKLGANPIPSQNSEQTFQPKRWELRLTNIKDIISTNESKDELNNSCDNKYLMDSKNNPNETFGDKLMTKDLKKEEQQKPNNNKEISKTSTTESTDEIINSCDKYLIDLKNNNPNETFGGKIMRKDLKKEERRPKPQIKEKEDQCEDLDLLKNTKPLTMPSNLPKFCFGSTTSSSTTVPLRSPLTTVITKFTETKDNFKFSEPNLKKEDKKSDAVLPSGQNGDKSYNFSSPKSAITFKSLSNSDKIENNSNIFKESQQKLEANKKEISSDKKNKIEVNKTETPKWVCVCLFQNIASDNKCKACLKERDSHSKPSTTNLSSVKTISTNSRVESNKKITLESNQLKTIPELNQSKTTFESNQSKTTPELNESKTTLESNESKTSLESNESKITLESKQPKTTPESNELKTTIITQNTTMGLVEKLKPPSGSTSMVSNSVVKPSFSSNTNANTGTNTSTFTTTNSAFGANTLFGTKPDKGFSFGNSTLNSNKNQDFSFNNPSTNSLTNTSSNLSFGLNTNAITTNTTTAGNTTTSDNNSKSPSNSLFSFNAQNSDHFSNSLTQKPLNNSDINSKTSSQFSFGVSTPSTGQTNSNNLFSNLINPAPNSSLSFSQMVSTAPPTSNTIPFTFGGFGSTPSASVIPQVKTQQPTAPAVPQIQTQPQQPSASALPQVQTQPQQPSLAPTSFNFTAQTSNFDFASLSNASSQPSGPVFNFSTEPKQQTPQTVTSNKNYKTLVFGNSNQNSQSFSVPNATTKPSFSFNMNPNTCTNTTATTTSSAFGANTLFGSKPDKGFSFGNSTLNSSQNQGFSFNIPSTNSLTNTSSNLNFGLNTTPINTTTADNNSKQTSNSLFSFNAQNSDHFSNSLTQKPLNNSDINSKTSSQFSFGISSPSTGQTNSNNLFSNPINPAPNSSLSFSQMVSTAPPASNTAPFTFGGFGSTPSAPTVPQVQTQPQPQQPSLVTTPFNFAAQTTPNFDFASLSNAGSQPSGPVFQFSAEQTSGSVTSNRSFKKAKRRLNPGPST